MSNLSFETGFTKPLDAAITIEEADVVTAFTLIVLSGTCTILGAARFQGQASEEIELTAGMSYTKTASQGCFLKGYVITPTGITNIDISK